MSKKVGFIVGISCSILGIALGYVGGSFVGFPWKDTNNTSNDNSGSSDSVTDEDKVIVDQLFDELTGIENDDSIEKKEEYDVSDSQNRYYDCKKDFTFEVLSPYNIAETKNYITITNQSNELVDFKISAIDEYEYLISPISFYEEGELYEASLNSDDVCFKEKKNSIRSIFFNIERQSPNKFEINENKITFYPLNQVIDFSQNDYYVIYKNNIKLNRGDLFCLSNDESVSMDSFVASFDKCEPFGEYYKISYVEPDLAEVFSVADYCDELDVRFGDDLEFADPTVLANSIAHDPALRNAFYYSVSEYYPVKKQFFKDLFTKYLKVTVKFEKTDTSIKISVVATCKVPVSNEKKNDSYLMAKFLFSNETKLKIRSDVSLKRGWFNIPTGVKANIDVTQITDTTHSFSVAFGGSNDKPEKTDVVAQDNIRTAMAKIKEKGYGWYEEKVPKFTDCAIKNNKLTFNFAKFHFFPLVLLDIEFSVGLELKFDFYGEINATYKHHTETVVGSYNSNSGFNKYSTPQKVESGETSLNLRAKIQTEANLFLGLSFSITGFSWLFELGLEAKIGVYANLTGFQCFETIEDSDSNSISNRYGGVSFEFGIKFEIGGKVKIIFVKLEFTLLEIKWPLKLEIRNSLPLGFGDNGTECIELFPQGNVNVFKETDLYVKQFSFDDLCLNEISYFSNKDNADYKGVIKIIITQGEEYFYINDNGDIIVRDNCPLEWKGKFKIVFMDGTIEAISEEYEIVYRSSQGQKIYFDDDDAILAEAGETITLPTKEGTDQRTFVGWKIEGTDEIYPGGSQYIVPDHDVHFVSVWETPRYHTVRFFNGLNVLISSQNVKDGEDAVAPSAEQCYIEGYEFVGWDREFTNVTKDIDVYGVYVKIV